ncbi:MAG: hydrogenase, partial [Kiritimatiellaeota bacterium]|nr:hydrogenase [Kiritimatiellota bacterium]
MEPRALLLTRYGRPLALSAVPIFSVDAFRAAVLDAVRAGGRLLALCGLPPEPRVAAEGTPLLAVVAPPGGGMLALGRTWVRGAYAAITPDCPAAHLFERELAEQYGVRPEGHPWLKPVRFPGGAAPGVTDFYRVAGDEIHEVAVGPVHAGIIEPGHFRFQCLGERVLHLEIALGYQHRGVERALRGGPNARTLHYMETLAGDTTIGHTLAYVEASEALAGGRVPPRAQALRGIALELERLANHTGDLGALANDVAFLPTASACGKIRGDFLNLTALLCGNRFGRGLVRP